MNLESYKGILRKNKIEVLLFFLLIIGLGIKFYRLSNPSTYYFDEIYFAFTAEEMAKGSRAAWNFGYTAPEGFAYEWVHPPLGKEITALGILIFGDNTFGWRFFQALFGVFGTLIVYLLGKVLFQSKRAGLFAAFLFTFESFIFVLSRITMVDIFLMVFILLASLFFVLYATKGKLYYIILTGVFCGFSISTKWSGALTLIFFGFLSLCFEVYQKRRQVVYQKGRKIKVQSPSIWTLSTSALPRLLLSFIVIPVIVYFLFYLPFFFHNYTWADFIELQKQIYYYHSGLKATHPYQSRWWQWLLLIRPLYLYLGNYGDKAAHIYAIGNPFIWWTGVVFLFYSLIEVARKESVALYFPILSVFAYWIPWSFSPRITFIYHFLPSIPFILIIIAYFLDSLWVRSRYCKAFVIVYLAFALGTFIYFYPILSAIPVSNDSVGRFFWLKSWR